MVYACLRCYPSKCNTGECANVAMNLIFRIRGIAFDGCSRPSIRPPIILEIRRKIPIQTCRAWHFGITRNLGL